MDSNVRRFRQRRLVLLAVVLVIAGGLLLLTSGVAFTIGVFMLGVGVGVGALALLFPLLSRLS
jgi:hypothetical protein